MRASRLVALLVHLSHRGGATAAALAEELEVSVRTIYRDVAALQAAGVPLWTEGGHGGGIRLVEGWRTRLDGLTADEAGALFLAGAPTAVDELGLGTVLAAAQAKVLSTLPPELADRAGRVRERFLLDAPGWFHHGGAPPALAEVAAAVWAGRRLDVRYGRPGRQGPWRLAPLGLVLKAGTWYLVAATGPGSSGSESELRTFRLDRISSAEARADEPVERPPGFDLARWWAASSTDFDQALQREPVRLRLGPRAAAALPHVMGTSAGHRALTSAGPPGADGWVETELWVESEEVALGQLSGIGGQVEVLDPPSLRVALQRVGAALADHNAGQRRTT